MNATPRRSIRARRTADDRGAALVEFALVFPFLALILFGIIEFGLAMNDYQSLRQAAREGAREAVVGNFSGGRTDCALEPTPAQQLVCLTKARAGTDDMAVRVAVTEGGEAGEYGSVAVCVAKRLSSYTGLMQPFINGRVLSSSIEMRIEREIELSDFAETPPAGTTWEQLCR